MKKIYLISFLIFFNTQYTYNAIIKSGTGNTIIGVTTITESGFYRLASDINNTTDATAITINASNVELDLENHTITGPGTPGINDICIDINGQENVVVKNGVLSQANDDAIRVIDSTSVQIQNIHCTSNQSAALIETSTAIQIQDCEFLENISNTNNYIINVSSGKDIQIFNSTFIRNITERIIDVSSTSQMSCENILIFDNENSDRMLFIFLLSCVGCSLKKIRIDQNQAAATSAASTVALATQSSSNIVVDDFIVSDNTIGGPISLISLTNTNGLCLNDCKIINNTINNSFVAIERFITIFASNGSISNSSINGNSLTTTSGLLSLAALFNSIGSNLNIFNMQLANNAITRPGGIATFNLEGSFLLLDSCVTTSNINNDGEIIGVNFRSGSFDNSVLKCLVKGNAAVDGASQAIGVNFEAGTTGNILRNNIISSNEGADSIGIFMEDSVGNTVWQNQVEDHVTNIAISGVTDVIPTATFIRSTGSFTPSAAGALPYDNISVLP